MPTTPTFNPPNHPFCGATHAKDLKKLDADAAVFAAPHGTSYRGNDGRVFEGTAKALRQALLLESNWLDHYDFDLEDTLYPDGSNFRLADLGDLNTASRRRPRQSRADRGGDARHPRARRHSRHARGR